MDVDEQVVNNAMATYDIDGAGSLELTEFLTFLRYYIVPSDFTFNYILWVIVCL